MENMTTSASSSYLSRLNFDRQNLFDNMFDNMEKERLARIKKLEKLRERRYFDTKSVRKIGEKGDFSYLQEHGKRLEEDMAIFKEIDKQRQEQENCLLPRPLSPLPPLFDISPMNSPKINYRLIGNEDYKAARLATMTEKGLGGAMQEFYGDEENPYIVSGPEGAAIAAERLNRINERIAKLKVRATEIQDGIQSHMGAVSAEEEEQQQQEINGVTTTSSSTETFEIKTPQIKITQDGDEAEHKE